MPRAENSLRRLRRRRIRRRWLFAGNVLMLAGIAVGLLITARTSKWLVAFLMGEEEVYDSSLFGLVAIALFGVTLLTSWIPARRAMRLDSVEALRND